MAYLNHAIVKRLNQKHAEIRKRRPLPSVAVAKLKEQFAIEMTYNSNAIEGNRLTLKETFLVVGEGMTVKGKSLKDHLEAKDHYEALHFLYELVEHERKQTLSEHLIRSLQELVIRESDPSAAGRYRSGAVSIMGSAHSPPEGHEIPHLMRQLMAWIQANARKLHPVELAALAHHRLVFIHPFDDGNGRTARLLMNLLLMQRGYPLSVILKNDRRRYYSVLDQADRGKYEPLVRFVAQSVERSLNLYLKALGPASAKKVAEEMYRPLSQIAKGSPYSTKYLNLLVRSGKLEAHKEGRNWVTTRAALDRYMAGRLRKRS